MVVREVAFISKKLQERYLSLGDSAERELLKFMDRAIDDLKDDPGCGIKVSQKLIPVEYKKMGIDNLWKYNLPGAWRILYSITGNKIKIVTVILDWMNHKDYERKFNY